MNISKVFNKLSMAKEIKLMKLSEFVEIFSEPDLNEALGEAIKRRNSQNKFPVEPNFDEESKNFCEAINKFDTIKNLKEEINKISVGPYTTIAPIFAEKMDYIRLILDCDELWQLIKEKKLTDYFVKLAGRKEYYMHIVS